MVLDTDPQPIDRIFTAEALEHLHHQFEVHDVTGDPDALDNLLPDTFAIVGQTDLPRVGCS